MLWYAGGGGGSYSCDFSVVIPTFTVKIGMVFDSVGPFLVDYHARKVVGKTDSMQQFREEYCWRERENYFKSHTSLWEHSSHFRLIGRGVPSVSVVPQLVYSFLCLASPKENPQVPI